MPKIPVYLIYYLTIAYFLTVSQYVAYYVAKNFLTDCQLATFQLASSINHPISIVSLFIANYVNFSTAFYGK